MTLPAQIFRQLLSGKDITVISMRCGFVIGSRRHVLAYQKTTETPDPFFSDQQSRNGITGYALLLDFISGMTDTYVLEEYRLLNGWV